MGSLNNNQIVKVNNRWYVETRTGYEGPFYKLDEAREYLLLSNTARAARMAEFAGLSFFGEADQELI